MDGEQHPTTIKPSGHQNYGKLAAVDPHGVLSMIRNGATLRQIAAQIGISNVSLRAWLLREERDEYKEAVAAALTIRIAEADEQLDGADDQASVARAAHICRYSRWDAERRLPHLFGQRQQLTVTQQPATLSRDQTLRAIAELERSLVVADQQQSSAALVDNAVDNDDE